MAHPSLIPWNAKSEWIEVYNDAYSGNYNKVLQAVENLAKWRDYMEWGCRSGMECTRGILQVTLKDKHVYPDTQTPAELHELQLMYSAEIMRFLNLVNDSGDKRNKKVSMYGRAKEIAIPDWVVNIRHQMAHGNILPQIDALRMAADYIVDWLKDNYWEQEKKEMKDITVENIQNVIEESLLNLLNVYVLLKEQSILGFYYIRDIQDPDIKELICAINRFSMQEVIVRCRPWESRDDGEDISVNFKNIHEYSIPRAVFFVLKLAKQFIYPEKICGINIMNIVVEKLIDDSVKHNGMRCDVWSTFLKVMHIWLKFPVLIKAMVDKSYNNTCEQAHQAGLWKVELCKALQKRFKVQFLQNTIIKESLTGKFSNNKKKAKFMNLDSSERKEFSKLLLKKNLNLIGKSDNRILACMFHRVEQKNANLRNVIRLQDPIFPEHWEVVDLIEHVALKPTEFSEQCLRALFNVMKWPLNSKSLLYLIKLGNIYRGECVTTHKVKRVFKSYNLSENGNEHSMKKHLREEFSDLYNYLDSKSSMPSSENNIRSDGNEPLDHVNTDENLQYLSKSEWITRDVIDLPKEFFGI